MVRNALADRLLLLVQKDLTENAGTDESSVRSAISSILSADPEAAPLPVLEKKELAGYLYSAVRQLDVLQSLLEDPSVTEIMVNGPGTIFLERNGVMEKSAASFASAEKLMDVIRQIAGSCNRVINERSPIVDARLPDGSRINAVSSPVALDGPYLTIRRFPEKTLTLDDLMAAGSLSAEAAALLRLLVRARYSFLISGATSAGKTTFLNALSEAIPAEERVITIEDNAELRLCGLPNLVRLEAKEANMEGAPQIPIRRLIRSALRMRPDRIIVGEVRGEEAVDMLQALNTGHDGSLSTIHANSAEDALSRLETMVLLGCALPPEAVRRQIASGIDLIVHLRRLPDCTRRVTEIAELCGINGSAFLIEPLFVYRPEEGRLVRTGCLRNTEKYRTGRIFSPDKGITPHEEAENNIPETL